MPKGDGEGTLARQGGGVVRGGCIGRSETRDWGRELDAFFEEGEEVLEGVALVADCIGPLLERLRRGALVGQVVSGGAATEAFAAGVVDGLIVHALIFMLVTEIACGY